MDKKMTHQGIYISPDNVIPNRDRQTLNESLILSKNEIINRLVKAKSDIEHLMTLEPSVDTVLGLVNLSETVQLALNYINKEDNN